MKTNLDRVFKTDSKAEKDGVWFQVPDTEVKFLLKRLGGSNDTKVKSAMAMYYKPKARLIELEQLSEEEVRSIMAKVLCEACLLDWEGIIDEETGLEIPFDLEKAHTLIKGLPELFDKLWKYASSADSYRVDVGNS